MTINQLITLIDAIKPNAFPTSAKIRWISNLECRIASEVLLLTPEETVTYNYSAKTENTALACELIVNPPYDDIYDSWLTAQIDFANGEYNKYQNSMQQFNARWDSFVAWFSSYYRPADGYPSDENTAAAGWANPPYYLTAYAIAVKHGFEGTEEEWIASLDGEDGEDGVSPTINSETITGGHRLTITDVNGTITVDVMDGTDGQDGEDGEDGEDGVSPTINSETITGGHRLTITDVNGTITVDVMDGADGQDGHGVSAGGAIGAALIKQTASDYDVIWKVLGAADVGAIPQILTSDYYGTALPAAGTAGRIFFLKV